MLDPEGPYGQAMVEEHQEQMLEIATALYEKDQMSWALRYFEPLLGVPDLMNSSDHLSTGRCYLDLGDKRRAEECFAAAIDADEQDEASIDARYELAKMYEAAREEREAYILVTEAMKLQGAREEEQEEEREMERDGAAYSDSDASSTGGGRGPRAARTKPKKLRAIKPKPRAIRPKDAGPRVQRAPREPKPKSKKPPRRRLFGLSEDVEREEQRRGEELASRWRSVQAAREQHAADGVRNPSGLFMSSAEVLIDDFRSYKDFYSWDKYLAYLGFGQEDKTFVTQKINLQAMAERLSHSKFSFSREEQS